MRSISALFDEDDPQITRARIAELAGVTRPTVTTWERRFPDFPSPRKAGGTAYFLRSEIVRWLDTRPVPSHLRHPEEGELATYGQRARDFLAGGEAKAHQPAPVAPQRRPVAEPADPRSSARNRQVVRELMGPLSDWVRGAGSMVNYVLLLVALQFLQVARRDRWDEVRAGAEAAERPGASGGDLLERIGHALDDEVQRLGMLPRFAESLSQLVPRNAGDLAHVVDLVGSLDGNAFQLIIDEYETHARLRSREFFTPQGVVRLMAAVARTSLARTSSPARAPHTVYDPYVRGGEFLVEAFTVSERARRQDPDRKPLRVFGQTKGRDAALLASLNLALRGVRSGVRLTSEEPWASAGAQDTAGWADLVLSNPPFNMKDSTGEACRTGTWPYGAPPLDNANFAYLQHALASLREGGRAALVMPNKAGNSGSGSETAIRRAIVEAGVLECIIALPGKLFTGTAVPVSVWLMRHPSDPCERVLFLDARHLGVKKGPRCVLEEEDLLAVLDAYRSQGAEPRVLPSASEGPDRRTAVPSASVERQALLYTGCSLNPLDHIRPQALGGQDVSSLEDAAERAWADVKRLAESSEQADARVAFLRSELVATGTGEAGWQKVKLVRLCEIKAGPSFTQLGSKDRSPDGLVPVVFPRHLRDGRITDTEEERVSTELAARLARFQLRTGDIVCVRSGKTAPPALVRPDQETWLMSPNVIRLRALPGAEVDVHYLHAWLRRAETIAWIEDRSAATAASSISTESLGRLEVVLPPLAQQRRVAELLESLEEQVLAHQQATEAVIRARSLLADQLMNPVLPGGALAT
ncbi:type I restriction-modification system subunit M/S [Streptomyces bambusae]|nr:type I restriction-modification system subunit M/S [Streptomyces bambusae]